MKRRISFVPLLALWASLASAQAPAASTAKAGIERLIRGNEAYASARTDTSQWGPERRLAVAAAQHPFATILTCSDSRVPPEMIFNQGLGDLFVVRVAGAVTDRAVLGSLEYAAEHLHVPLLVVMGHSSCGAVKSAMESKTPAKQDPAGLNLEAILSAIRPSLSRAAKEGDSWRNAVYASIRQNISDVLRRSPVLAEMQRENKITLLGAFYDLNSGKVEFLEAPAAAKTAAKDSRE